MLNFRKLKKDFSTAVLEQGKQLFSDERVISAKVVTLDPYTIKVVARIQGQYDNFYETEIEIDREACETIDTNCDCPESFDCAHLAALMQYMETNLNQILVEYSNTSSLNEIHESVGVEDEIKEELLEQLEEAKARELQRRTEARRREVLEEYVAASSLLATSPFFRSQEKKLVEHAEFAIVINFKGEEHPERRGDVEVQIAMRLPCRSKPLVVPHLGFFIEAVNYCEPILIGGKRYTFSTDSFGSDASVLMPLLLSHIRPREKSSSERGMRVGYISKTHLGLLLARGYELGMQNLSKTHFPSSEEELPSLPCLFLENLEEPIRFSVAPSNFSFNIEYLDPPLAKILLKPCVIAKGSEVSIDAVQLLECAKPGLLFSNTYHRFSSYVTRSHLRNLVKIKDSTIPEPLFGSFVENSLVELARKSQVQNRFVVEKFVTLPYTLPVQAHCKLTFLDGQLDAAVFFNYEGRQIPAAPSKLKYEDVSAFCSEEGILARNLVEEHNLLDELFADFQYNTSEGVYFTKSEKKIVEFMTDIVPRFDKKVQFECPQNLLDQFVYDQTQFELNLEHTARVDFYSLEMVVTGPLRGVSVDQLWDCVASRKAFIELENPNQSDKQKMPKILVLDMQRISGIIQVFDELGIVQIDTRKIQRPLWSIANIDASHFEGLPVKFSMSKELAEIRSQMLGEKEVIFSDIPKTLTSTLRSYQIEGVHWLERLRKMYLNGILADDMGLGKTVQAITAILQAHQEQKGLSLIVCPTSLLYNWKEECGKFAPHLRVLVIDGVPTQRKKLIDNLSEYDLVVTSYTLLQKDVDLYKKTTFIYAILDEAQHIKNRGTRNARSVKMVEAKHRLILSGTPIENSLDELWSLFDFLMPGFLSSFDRFMEKYIRSVGEAHTKNIHYLRQKVAPFIMRRMKSDVLDDLPPVSELLYHCQLSPIQQELYNSYAASARDELTKLVARDGFDRVQIHVLATLTRLKQICCHPAIFAKEKAEPGDSAKYDMLLDLLQTLIEGNHKTVIFSQYTRMLQIMKEDLEKMGIRFAYLDGSSKNRLEIVKNFNENESISVFLVSLKAGGTGLNLVSADTVIHYDMWWNPAVENQATDRVHRLGQKRNVSAYKLITLGSIEEKIAEMQARKKGLVKKVVSCDDEAISKLTWEDVLELLKT